MSRTTIGWALAAIGGLVLAAAVGWATSSLTSQHIGLSSEPLSSEQRLAPSSAGGTPRATGRPAPAKPKTGGATTETPTPVRTVTVPGPPAASPPATTPTTVRPGRDEGAGGQRDD